MIEKEIATKLLTELEKFRQKHEHDEGTVDWSIRVCQAIVAREAGYNNRNDWSSEICEIIRLDISFQDELKDLFLRRIRNKNKSEVIA